MQPVMVHTRRFLDSEGRIRVEEVVQCREKSRLRNAEACLTCLHGSGIVYDEVLEADVVRCNHPSPSEIAIVPRGFIEEGSLDGLHNMPVGDICTRDIVCVEPTTPLPALREAFSDYAVGAIPVLENPSRAVGIVSPVDLLIHRKGAHAARDVMTADPMIVEDTMSASRAAAVMAYEGIHHLLVRDASTAVAGILSSLDVLRVLAQKAGAIVPRRTARQRR
ncbi:MAG: CBS domain-containing protein [Polyangiaceae bacterium]